MGRLASNAPADQKPHDERVTVVHQLRGIMAWLDANDEPFAAIHVNQAIEALDPTPNVTLAETDSFN